VLPLAKRLGVPVVFDVFHHRLAPSLDGLSTRELAQLAGETWSEADGRQKIHFSTQAPGKRRGAHDDTIDLDAFRGLVAEVGDLQARLHARGEGQRAVGAAREGALGLGYLAPEPP
jgi:UV DNA damage endonuclease